MKKGRPGIVLHVICENEIADKIKNIIFSESTSLGIRTFTFRKDTLTRKQETINTRFGDVRIKRSFYAGVEVSAKPEYDDCKRIAAENELPLKEVYNRIMAIISNSKA